MNRISRLASVAVFAVALAACGGGEEEDSGENFGVQLPSTLVGQSITYTVTDPGTAGIPAGFKIKWTFSSGGSISGVNPVSGVTYKPNSYTYKMSGGKGFVDVRYVQGTQTAYEIYTMTGQTQTTGTYTYEGNTGTGVKYAAGTYVVN